MDARIRIDLPTMPCAAAGFLTAGVGSLVLGGLFATWYGFGSVLHVLLVVLVGYMLAMRCTSGGGDLFGMISFFYLPQDARTAPGSVESRRAPALEHATAETVPLAVPEAVPEPARAEGPADSGSRGARPALLSAPRASGPDDLKRLKGVGPKLEAMLNEMGVYHFDQIAGWTAAELAWVDDHLGSFRGRAERDDWVGQAKALTKSGQ